MTPSTTAARVLLDELVRLGVRDLVLCPGSRSAPLAYAAHELEAAGRLRLHVRVDERSAAFLALGLGKRTGVPAVVVTTSGTAVANLHPAVLEAHHASVPLLLLTADRPPELRGVGANQATTQPGIFGGSTRLALDLETPADPDRQAVTWRTSAARAVAAATGALTGQGTAGPVHISLPLRDPLTPSAAELAGGLPAPEVGGTADRGAIAGRADGRPWVELPDAAAQIVPGAGGPALPHDDETLVVVGELPTVAHRRAALDWAAHHAAPVVAEPGPGTGVTVLPHGALLLGASAWLAGHRPRRVVVVGRPTLGRAVPALTRTPGVRVDIVTPVEPAADGWADATGSASAVHPMSALAVTGPAHEPSPWSAQWFAAGEAVESALAEPEHQDATSASAPEGTAPEGTVLDETVLDETVLDGAAVARTLHASMPEGARIMLGSSSVARDLHLGVARPRDDLDVVTSRGLAGIDGLVSTAAGLSLADPEVPSYALLGDLTFVHDGNGLVVGPHEPSPDLTIVVVDDDGGSIFATLEYGVAELADPFERLFATPTRTDVVELARAHGAAAVVATTRAELVAAVSAPPSGLTVVVVRVDLHARRGADAERRDRVARALQPPRA